MFRPSSWLRNGTFVFIQCRRRVLLKRESLEYKFRHKISIMEGKQRIYQERNQHQTFQLTREKNKILICCKFNTRNSFAHNTNRVSNLCHFFFPDFDPGKIWFVIGIFQSSKNYLAISHNKSQISIGR